MKLKAFLFTALLAIATPLQAMNLYDLVEKTPTAKLVDVFPCSWEMEMYTCYEIQHKGTPYRIVTDEDQNIAIVLTPQSEKYPEGTLTPEQLIYADSI